MTNGALVPWEAKPSAIIPDSANTATEIVEYARQLSKREMDQIRSAFQAGQYEMASTYVWSKAIAALQKQLASLGMEFIGEILQRPDINESSAIAGSVTPFETITLAEDLGMVSPTEAMRMRHANEVISHFASSEGLDDGEHMTPEEAVGCLRTCVQNILGHQKLEVAQNFAKFRKELEERDFDEHDIEIENIRVAPYFYRKTTLSILLALLRTRKGALLEHAVRNTQVVLPGLWRGLKKPEKWQAGQTYAELCAEGKSPASQGLKRALIEVSGFDYVPENLRSSTYVAAAKAVLQAHDGVNNYYNEPAPMKALAALGSTIPSPAFPICMQAVLSVRLGNAYGVSWAAQDSANAILESLSDDRWVYYFEECLPYDRTILFKLGHSGSGPQSRWGELVRQFSLQKLPVSRQLVVGLLGAGFENNNPKIGNVVKQMISRMNRAAERSK